MALLPVFDVAGPGLVAGLLVFGVAFVIILFLLILLVETVALQLLHWGDFRSSLKASFLMNLASTVVGLLFLWLVPALGFLGIFIAWALSVLIETLVLMRLRRGREPAEPDYCAYCQPGELYPAHRPVLPAFIMTIEQDGNWPSNGPAAGSSSAPVIAAGFLPSTSLGLAHGVSDCAVGFLIGGLALGGSPAQAGWLALAYNGLAFGLQPVAGWLADRSRRYREMVLAGLSLSARGVIAFRSSTAYWRSYLPGSARPRCTPPAAGWRSRPRRAGRPDPAGSPRRACWGWRWAAAGGTGEPGYPGRSCWR